MKILKNLIEVYLRRVSDPPLDPIDNPLDDQIKNLLSDNISDQNLAKKYYDGYKLIEKCLSLETRNITPNIVFTYPSDQQTYPVIGIQFVNQQFDSTLTLNYKYSEKFYFIGKLIIELKDENFSIPIRKVSNTMIVCEDIFIETFNKWYQALETNDRDLIMEDT